MNKQDLSAQTKVPVNSIDSIFCAMGLPKDLPDYNDEHVNLIQAVRDLHKNEGCKSWAEAVGLYRKPINEAQLKEIAARYSLGDRIPELMSALKLKPECITDGQFEQFRLVCEQVQQGIDLEIVAQGVLNKANAKPSVPGGKAQSERGGAALTQRKEDRPVPSFASASGLKAVAKVDLTGIPVEDGVAKTWDEVAKVGAASDADALAGAPFDGIIEGSEYVNEKAEDLKQHGFNLYMEKFDEAMHDPELAKRVEDKYLGKFPARWNLKPKN